MMPLFVSCAQILLSWIILFCIPVVCNRYDRGVKFCLFFRNFGQCTKHQILFENLIISFIILFLSPIGHFSSSVSDTWSVYKDIDVRVALMMTAENVTTDFFLAGFPGSFNSDLTGYVTKNVKLTETV